MGAGGVFGRWSKRFFRLEAGLLLYYTCDPGNTMAPSLQNPLCLALSSLLDTTARFVPSLSYSFLLFFFFPPFPFFSLPLFLSPSSYRSSYPLPGAGTSAGGKGGGKEGAEALPLDHVLMSDLLAVVSGPLPLLLPPRIRSARAARAALRRRGAPPRRVAALPTATGPSAQAASRAAGRARARLGLPGRPRSRGACLAGTRSRVLDEPWPIGVARTRSGRARAGSLRTLEGRPYEYAAVDGGVRRTRAC
jgi:hypothetical protein